MGQTNMKLFKKIIITVSVLLFSMQSFASLLYDQDLVGGVFFGDGNKDGSFTVETQNGIEVGLRGKLRFDENNNPQSIYNSNNDGSYSFDNIAPPIGYSWAMNSSATSLWNWDWSIDLSNSQYAFSDLTFLMEIDYDPTLGTNFFSFDPINTPNDNDINIGNTTQQNSANMEFFSSFLSYTNTDIGVYDIRLSVFDGSTDLLASSEIQIIQGVQQVPEPSTLAIFALGIVGLTSRHFLLGKKKQ